MTNKICVKGLKGSGGGGGDFFNWCVVSVDILTYVIKIKLIKGYSGWWAEGSGWGFKDSSVQGWELYSHLGPGWQC